LDDGIKNLKNAASGIMQTAVGSDQSYQTGPQNGPQHGQNMHQTGNQTLTEQQKFSYNNNQNVRQLSPNDSARLTDAEIRRDDAEETEAEIRTFDDIFAPEPEYRPDPYYPDPYQPDPFQPDPFQPDPYGYGGDDGGYYSGGRHKKTRQKRRRNLLKLKKTFRGRRKR
jgi:hypothetical protein